MVDRSLLRLSATLVVIGEVLFALVTAFHPGREDPNNHPAVFAEYASSASWTAVHFGQFVLMAVLLVGLLVLFFALNVRSHGPEGPPRGPQGPLAGRQVEPDPRNSADAVKPPTASSKEMRPLSAREARRLLEAARGDRLEALYVLGVTTGMRRGELLGLKWSDIDLKNATVSIRRALTRTDNGKRVALGEVKNKKSRRTIRLTPRAVDALKAHRSAS